MTINACVENKRTSSLPYNFSPVVLIFKDEGGLAYHPFSSHPQGVFGMRETEGKGKKMREKKKSGKKNESFHAKSLLHQSCFIQVLTEAYILLKTREITKMYEVPQIHRG